MQPRRNSERIGHRCVPEAALHGKLNGELAAVRGLAAGPPTNSDVSLWRYLGRQPQIPRRPLSADTVAKVVLHRWSEFLRAVGVVFVQSPEGPCHLTLNSSAILVARLRLYESLFSARFNFSPKIQTAATFDFCNSICQQRHFTMHAKSKELA